MLGKAKLLPLEQLIDLDAVLIQQKFIKELKALTWLKEHSWLNIANV